MKAPDLDDVAIVLMILAAIAAVTFHQRSLRNARRGPPEDRR